MDNLKEYADWAIANWQLIAAAVAGTGTLGSVIWVLVMKYVPDMFVDMVMTRIEMALAGKTTDESGKVIDIPDADDRLLVVRVMSAFVEWAEKKIPDEGCGAQKLRLVLDKIYSTARRVPVIGAKVEAKLREKESKIVEFINAVVLKMNKRLRNDASKG